MDFKEIIFFFMAADQDAGNWLMFSIGFFLFQLFADDHLNRSFVSFVDFRTFQFTHKLFFWCSGIFSMPIRLSLLGHHHTGGQSVASFIYFWISNQIQGLFPLPDSVFNQIQSECDRMRVCVCVQKTFFYAIFVIDHSFPPDHINFGLCNFGFMCVCVCLFPRLHVCFVFNGNLAVMIKLVNFLWHNLLNFFCLISSNQMSFDHL